MSRTCAALCLLLPILIAAAASSEDQKESVSDQDPDRHHGRFAQCSVSSDPSSHRQCVETAVASRTDRNNVYAPPYHAAAGAHLLLDSDHAAASGRKVNTITHGLPPGHTRSRIHPSYALIAPESRVFGDPPRGWTSPANAAAVVTPALGAHFAMYLVQAPPSTRTSIDTSFPGAPSTMLERFFFVLTGALHLCLEQALPSNDTPPSARPQWDPPNLNIFQNPVVCGAKTPEPVHTEQWLRPGSFLYLPPNISDTQLVLQATEETTLIQIDRPYSFPAGEPTTPPFAFGAAENVQAEVPPGEVFQLRRLLNASDPSYDFNIHLMDFEPGQYLGAKEMHYNQHGLMILTGEGIYLLGADFVPVQAGDFIWMAPFCLQWYAALGPTGTRYFLYKDTRTDPLRHFSNPNY